MDQAAGRKVCHRCGQDCARRPRIRDPHGRYFCKACLSAQELAELGAGPAEASQAAALAPSVVVRASASVPSAAGSHTRAAAEPDPYAVADEARAPVDEPAGEPADGPLALAEPEASLPVCRGCQSSLPYGATLCTQCGLDQRTGRVRATTTEVDEDAGGGARRVRAVSKKGACPQCGYSLKGLKGNVCPECGTALRPENYRDRLRTDSRRIARNEYLKPLGMFAAGVVLTLVILGAKDRWDLLPNLIGNYVVDMVLGNVLLFLCMWIWIGFDSPTRLNIVRLAGVFAIMMMLWSLIGDVPIGFMFRWGLMGLIQTLMICSLMEFDLEDGIIFSALLFVSKLVLTMILLAQLGG